LGVGIKHLFLTLKLPSSPFVWHPP